MSRDHLLFPLAFTFLFYFGLIKQNWACIVALALVVLRRRVSRNGSREFDKRSEIDGEKEE